jgi:hypothetical protein
MSLIFQHSIVILNSFQDPYEVVQVWVLKQVQHDNLMGCRSFVMPFHVHCSVGLGFGAGL